MPIYHPGLGLARVIPRISYGPRIVRLLQSSKPRPMKAVPAGISIQNVTAPGVSLRVYRPTQSTGPLPALLWLHGGGYLFGTPEQDDAAVTEMVGKLGIVAVSVRYRLAPADPAPAALDDAYAGLSWLFTNADELGIDAGRVAIGGASAGGGLAAALVLLANDRREWHPVFQLLVYPMLDDRTVTRTDLDTRHVRVWEPGSNRFAWGAYLGQEPGLPTAPPYVVPARREDLGGLPPAWIGVGSLDLFHDEDVAYAERLRAAGVPCELQVIPGAFHGFDAIFRRAAVSRVFLAEQIRVLGEALSVPVSS